jgi:hypothetical protein
MDRLSPVVPSPRSQGIPALLILTLVQFSLCGPLGDLSAVLGIGEGTRVEAATGGTVSDGGGASVVIPPGALAEDTRVLVRSYANLGSVAQSWAMTPGLLGGAEFGPDGLTFEQPVTVTLPSLVPAPPGASYPVYAYNQEAQRWAETEFTATVSPDGGSLQAEVTHFTLYGVFSLPEMAVMEHFQRFLEAEGNPEAAFNAYVNWYTDSLQLLEMRILHEGCCYSITGIQFVLSYDLGGVSGVLDRLVGEVSPLKGPGFEYYGEVAEGGQQHAITLKIDYYLGCRPDLRVQVGETVLSPGETTTVRARLTCGDQPMADRQVSLSVTGPGTIQPSVVQTAGDGEAEATFTAGDGSGQADVTGQYRTCTCLEDYPELQGTITQTAVIEVQEEERWSGTYTLTWEGEVTGITGTTSIDFTFTVLDQTWAEYDPDVSAIPLAVSGEPFDVPFGLVEETALVGTGTARQGLQASGLESTPDCIAIFDAPAILAVDVMGGEDDAGQAWIYFTADHFWDLTTTCMGSVASLMLVGTPERIPLEQGTYQGVWPNDIGTYRITLERP